MPSRFEDTESIIVAFIEKVPEVSGIFKYLEECISTERDNYD